MIDFTKGQMGYRLSHVQGRNELLAKAIGFKKSEPLHLFDTTAGIGKEAFLMATLGCKVTLFERNVHVANILKQNLDNARKDPNQAPVLARMHLIEQCAIHYFKSATFERPDVIYCDPMFEPRPKTALVKKEIRALQSIVGVDLDAKELVNLSLKFAQKRVVVKRPNYSPPVLPNPNHQIKGKNHRFDVYLSPKGIDYE